MRNDRAGIRWVRGRMKIPLVVLATALSTGFGIVLGFWAWFDRVYTENTTFVRIASGYRVAVLAQPNISARLYSLGYAQEYLLVLTSESSNVPESYYLNLSTRVMGVPNLPQFVPLFNGALVNRDCGGFAIGTQVEAGWEIKDNGKEVHICIKGLTEEAHRFDGNPHPYARDAEFMPLGYQREIVLWGN